MTLNPVHSDLKPFTLLVIIVIAVAALVVAMPQVRIPDIGSHAYDRHADVISAATNCFGGAGTISSVMMSNPTTNRNAWMCQLLGKMYIWITDKNGNTVTMFANKSKTFDAAMLYLKNAGYLP